MTGECDISRAPRIWITNLRLRAVHYDTKTTKI